MAVWWILRKLQMAGCRDLLLPVVFYVGVSVKTQCVAGTGLGPLVAGVRSELVGRSQFWPAVRTLHTLPRPYARLRFGVRRRTPAARASSSPSSGRSGNR